ncbi:hypothetical protein M441DRAFT_397005 [Trichoderma asperellum CBS 433.97]|uniref:Uncharacterized protein n=1 Tax=Trichoderma asperellum (strain ATCC 204424 / CBS 433.97 / NBRC 101777) TaxID=1042311 RepID=A0A2T3Z963_TRIA4|nr:hypothetical protein M441DRAFT_397005 [Trichoderma asperellum CBS 433.97]PTB41351.1 hypothetical protein M441DRAFT_397005 [Trichoderma asperellum CBS 433.97]
MLLSFRCNASSGFALPLLGPLLRNACSNNDACVKPSALNTSDMSLFYAGARQGNITCWLLREKDTNKQEIGLLFSSI